MLTRGVFGLLCTGALIAQLAPDPFRQQYRDALRRGDLAGAKRILDGSPAEADLRYLVESESLVHRELVESRRVKALLNQQSDPGHDLHGAVFDLARNQIRQGHSSDAWATYRSAIARAENAGWTKAAFSLRLAWSDALLDAGVISSALEQARAANASPGEQDLFTARWRMDALSHAGDCEGAQRVRREYDLDIEGGCCFCVVAGPADPPHSTEFRAKPGMSPENEMLARIAFGHGLSRSKEDAALRKHFAETISVAAKYRLPTLALNLAKLLALYPKQASAAEFQEAADGVAQLAPADMVSLDAVGSAWLQRGDAARATVLFHRTREVRLNRSGPWSRALVDSLEWLEKAALQERNWTAAAGFATEAASILAVIAGPHSQPLAEHLLASAERLQSAGESEFAKPFWDRALPLAEEAFGSQSRPLAAALEVAAKALRQDDPERAANLAARSVAVRSRYPDPSGCWAAKP